MRRREFIGLVGSGAAAFPFSARAQQPRARLARVGVLSPFLASGASPPAYDRFVQTLRELGWAQGQNVIFEYRFADGDARRLPALAAELVQLKLDVIFCAWGTPTALAAKAASKTIPIVFAGVGDAIGVGLVASLARPGGNITGSTFLSEATVAKQLDLLREAVPAASAVGVLINPSNPVYTPVLRASEAPAKALKLRLKVLGVQTADDFDGVFEDAIRDRVDGLVVLRDPVLVLNAKRLVELAERYRLPTLYGLREFVVVGGLMSYGPNLRDMYQRAAYLVDEMLRGANPSEVPVEQSTKFETAINLRAAKAIGLEIPTSILLRADEVIE